MNVLLTGGAGYIGSHVVLSLIDAGHDVHIIDNLSTGTELLIPKDTPFTKCDIDDQKTITSLIQNNKFDLLMHFAGYIQVEESVKKPNKYFDGLGSKKITNDIINYMNVSYRNYVTHTFVSIITKELLQHTVVCVLNVF